MSKSLLYIIFPAAIFCLLILFGFAFFQSNTRSLTIVTPIGSESAIPSPINDMYANVLGLNTPTDKAVNDYFPRSFSPESLDDSSDMDVEAYMAFDRDTRKILYGKNITKKLPIASLTKIVATIVALENAPLDLELYVSSQAANAGEAFMGLSPGEIIRLEDALYGMMLPSGNDAAEAVAEGVGKFHLNTPQEETDGGGARQWFLDRMNEKMQLLGLYDSYFFNPSGLDEDDIAHTNFSTALDMAILTNYALSNNDFAKIAKTAEWFILYKEGKHKAFYLYNILSFNRSYPGIKGVKPGVSDFAKETLASYVENDGRKITVVILGSKHTKDDVVSLYNKIFGTNIGVY